MQSEVRGLVTTATTSPANQFSSIPRTSRRNVMLIIVYHGWPYWIH